MANTKLWIDDLRIPPDDTYDIARTFNEALDLLSTQNYEKVYLDHDLACWDEDGSELTGYSVVLWLADQSSNDPSFYTPCCYYMLTDNPVGRKNMTGVIERYLGHVEPWTKPADLKSLEPQPMKVIEVVLKVNQEEFARRTFHFSASERDTSMGMSIDKWRQEQKRILLNKIVTEEMTIDNTPYDEDTE